MSAPIKYQYEHGIVVKGILIDHTRMILPPMWDYRRPEIILKLPGHELAELSRHSRFFPPAGIRIFKSVPQTPPKQGFLGEWSFYSQMKKALKSNDFKAFYIVETVGFEPMTSTLPV